MTASPIAMRASAEPTRCMPDWPIRGSALRNHPAFEHLVRDRRRDLVDERRAHLRIAAQKLHKLLLLRGFRLALRLPQLLAGGLLVFLGDFLGDQIQYR